MIVMFGLVGSLAGGQIIAADHLGNVECQQRSDVAQCATARV